MMLLLRSTYFKFSPGWGFEQSYLDVVDQQATSSVP